MKKGVALSTMTAMCGISAYCVYRKKIKKPFMSKKEVQSFVTTFSQPYGKKEDIHRENILLSDRCSLGVDPAYTGINSNVLVLGGSGQEQKELMQANLLQCNGSYIVTDPTGELLATTGAYLEQSGYEVKVLNLTGEGNSLHYNPLCYLEEEMDVRMMARYLLEMHSFGDMGIKAAELSLLEALLLYFWKFQPENKRTLNHVYESIRELGKNPYAVTDMFKKIELEHPDEMCLKKFERSKELARNDLAGTAVQLSKKISYLGTVTPGSLTLADELDLKQIVSRPTVIYIVSGFNKEGYGWLYGMLVNQMIDILSRMRKICELKYPIRFLLDDFCSEPIQGFAGRLSSNRRLLMRDASFLLFTKGMEEIHSAYPEELGYLLFACDTVLCYQPALIRSAREIARLWGGKCVKTHNQKGTPYRIASRFNEHDLEKVAPDQVVIIVRGLKPIRDNVFKIKNYLDADWLGSVNNLDAVYSYIRPIRRVLPVPDANELKTRKAGEYNGK